MPPPKTRLEPWEYDREMFKRRNEVERRFRRLKGYRRIFSRFDMLDVMFLGFISFVLVADGLRLCQHALVSCPVSFWHLSCMPVRYLRNGDTAMRTGKPKVELQLTDEERSQLQSFARSRSLPAALSNRARIVFISADGEPNNAIAERLKLTRTTVGKWRARFIERRIPGLYDDVRPGKPRTIDDERVAQLIKTTLHTKPANGSTHWSVRTVAAETGISKTSVQRYFQLFGLQPHRTESFKLSDAPFFIEKLRDVVGLYLSPPDKALVICVDEKSQCQALERTQPMLPMGAAMSRVSPTTTSATARPRCSRR